MKVGDYVRILPGVHDSSMPPSRRDGLVVEIILNRYKVHDQAIIMFSNGKFLKFHASQIEVINEKR